MGALLTGCAGTDAQQDAGSGTVNTGSGEPVAQADKNVQAACNGAVDNNVPAAQGEAHMESAGTSEVAALTQEELAMKRSEDKLAQFEQIIGDIVTRSLLENNVALGRAYPLLSQSV